MNIHHIELFYYVAKYEGIVAACRQIPYGIQQPAVSAQVAALEEDLGVRLFERRPFRLTSAGKTLYDFIAPFFGRLGEMESILKGKLTQTLRLAGLTEVMREHVPSLLVGLRKMYPDLKVTLQEIDQRGAERLIGQGEADLAITVLETRLPSGFHSVVLARLPLCLLVSPEAPWKNALSVIKAAMKEDLPLVSLPAYELLPRLFQRELSRRQLIWRTTMETSSQDLVTIYVRQGLGVGLAVRTPDLEKDPQLRVLPLPGFPTLPIGAFWRGKLSAIGQTLLQALESRSRQMLEKR